MEHHITTLVNARYFSFGNPSAPRLIVALHGYGQLASYFIRKFHFLDPEQYFVIVPEGLHRFYLDGTSGRVGASWMTREDRENDIANYIRLIDTILGELNLEKSSRKILLGFSQGGATASRYMASGRFTFDTFILWAAVFPPDMEEKGFGRFSLSRNYFVAGTSDPYYPAEVVVNETRRFASAGVNMEFRNFEGAHTIDPGTLSDILDEL